MTINTEQARVIDRLREAAKEHDEVANLLSFLASDVRCKASGPVANEYLAAVLSAAAFSELDRGRDD